MFIIYDTTSKKKNSLKNIRVLKELVLEILTLPSLNILYYGFGPRKAFIIDMGRVGCSSNMGIIYIQN